MSRLRHWAGWLLALVLLGLAAAPVAHARLSREDLNHALQSTVLIYTLDNNLDILGSGSGSIVDSRGLVLTNFHVVGDPDREALYNRDGIVVVAVTRDPRKPAVPVYFGQVVRGSAPLDLALVRVVADIEGNDLRGCQTLPTYDVGDSDAIQIGDEFAIIGFPGIGGQSVTFTQGTVSGFESEGEEVLWIKTDAEANPGNSGGSAVADDGSLVGVLTAGVVDQTSAGKLSLVRPINLAEALLANLSTVGVVGCDARGGTSPGGKGTPPGTNTGSTRTPGTIEMLGFTLSDSDSEYLSVAPRGITELYGNFEYSAIVAATPFRSQWRYNGEVMEETVLEFDEWPLDPGTGTAYVVTSNENGLPDGTYRLEVQAGDLPLISGEVEVGGGTAPPVSTSEEVLLMGRIFSADSGRPLRDAMFIILAPGITWETFNSNNGAHVYDLAFSDAEGFFQTALPVALDTAYSVGVAGEGFVPLLVDGFVPGEYEFSGNFLDLGEIELKSE